MAELWQAVDVTAAATTLAVLADNGGQGLDLTCSDMDAVELTVRLTRTEVRELHRELARWLLV